MNQDIVPPLNRDNGSLFAGVGRSDITVDDSNRAIRDRLFAKALALFDGQKHVIIVTMDAVAIGGICDISDDFLPALRKRVESEFSVPGEHVLVNASHTHPPDRILCQDEELIERTLAAIRQALQTQQPVLTGAGKGHEDGFIMNRNIRLKNGKHWTIRHSNPSPPDEEVESVGPVDSEIGVLRLDRLDGQPLAIVYNFACHLLFGDPIGSITGNFVGIASQIIEDEMPEGSMAFFLQGAAGDVIDTQFKDFGRTRNIEPLGLKLGQRVLETARSISTKASTLSLISERVEFPRRNDSACRIATLQEEQTQLLESLRFTSLSFKSFLPLYLQHALDPKYPAMDRWAYLQAEKAGDTKVAAMDSFNRQQIEKYLSNIRAMECLARIQDELATFARHEEINRVSGSETITAELQGIRVGDFVLLSAPLEVLTEVGMRVKAASPHEHTYIAAFSNGYMHYGPSADAYDKGGYEVVECFLAPEWNGIFETAAQSILQRV